MAGYISGDTRKVTTHRLVCLLYTSVSGRHISVDAPFVEGEDNSLLDVLVNDDSPMADRSLVNE